MTRFATADGVKLPGRLAASTLGDLLGQLYRERTTGLLELLENAGRRHRIELAFGLVVGVETDAAVPPIGELLRRRGLVDAGGVTRLLRRLASGDARPAGEILVAEGLISRDAVD